MATVVSVVESALALIVLVSFGIIAMWYILRKKHIKEMM